jgi:hypothetical protein
MRIEEFNKSLIEDIFLSTNELFPSDAVLFLKNNNDWIAKIGNTGNSNIYHIEIPDLDILCHGVCLNEDASELTILIGDISKNKDRVELISEEQIETYLRKGGNFVLKSFTEEIFDYFDESESDKLTLADQVRDNKSLIENIRFLVVTNRLFEDNDLYQIDLLMGKSCTSMVISLYDLYEFWKAESEEFIPPNIDFLDLGFEIPVIQIDQGSDMYDGYMAAINGIALYEIYDEHDINLLQGNVRFFLNATRKQNKGIQKTLKEEPEMFFAYNNGISATADNISFEEKNGVMYIKTVDNLQIVNGGQTTASVHFFGKEEKNRDNLEKVFVPMKLSVLKVREGSSEFLNNISRWANTQNTVKLSDLGSNDYFNEGMEKWARKTTIPETEGKKWFYERKTGDFFTMGLLLTKRNDVIGLARFKNEFDKKRLIKKTEMAIVLFSWGFVVGGGIDPRPYDAGKGAEKNYDKFQAFISKNTLSIDENFYKVSIAKFILHQKVKDVATEMGIPQQRNHVVNYTVALLSEMLKGDLNFIMIWDNQNISPDLGVLISQIIVIVWNDILISAKNINLDTWCKKIDCWNNIKQLKVEIGGEIPELSNGSITEVEKKNSNQTFYQFEDVIQDSTFWFKMAAKAKELNCFSPRDRVFFYNMGVYIDRKYSLTKKQIAYAQKCFKMIDDSGIIGE